MTLAPWIALVVLVALLGAMQVVGLRALAAWGVQPSRAVVVLRAVNFAAVVVVVAYAVWWKVAR
ncbi:MAG: hypothetical protein U1E22_05120 [Coriobacteriia bacterium]|nr:hypothetical protein [Coriobacteriia bacterium]